MTNILKVDQRKQLIRILPAYFPANYDKKKPHYRYNYKRSGWEKILIWDLTPATVEPSKSALESLKVSYI